MIFYIRMQKNNARIIQINKISDPRGNLSVIEEQKDIPFKIARTHWVYDVPGGEERWGHAFKQNEEFIVALSGSFDIVLDNGIEKQTFSLNRSYFGLYVPNGYWREIKNFSTNSVAMILSSTAYNPDDYIRDYEIFKSLS